MRGFPWTQAGSACADDAAWHRKKKPAKTCVPWVATKAATRCAKAGADGRDAADACAFTCGTCCEDDAAWHKRKKPHKTCAWVAKNASKRCAKGGDDGRVAADACRAACGGCPAPETAAAAPAGPGGTRHD